MHPAAASWMSVLMHYWPRLGYVALGDMGKLLGEVQRQQDT